MNKYEIFFYPNLGSKGIHVYQCIAVDLSSAYRDWTNDFPDGLAYRNDTGWNEHSDTVIHQKKINAPVVVERPMSFRDKFEARKDNRK